MQEIRTLIGTAWQLDRRRVLGQIVFLTLNGVLSGVGLLLLVPIVNTVADTTSTVQVPVIGSMDIDGIPLPLLLAVFLVLVIAQAAVAYRSSVNSSLLQQLLVDHLRHRAFAAVLTARWSHILALRRSDIIQTITTGSMRSGAAVSLLLNASITFVTAIATAIVAILVSPVVSGLAVLGVLVLAAVQSRGIGAARHLGRLSTERNKALQAVVVDSLDSLRLVRAHYASGVWIDRLAEAFTSARSVQLAAVERQSMLTAVSTVATASAAATLVLVATAADVDPALIVIIILLIGRLSRNAQNLVRTLIQLANALPAVSDIGDLTDEAMRARETPDLPSEIRAALPTTSGESLMTFDSVSFQYPDSGRGVFDIDLAVPVGRVTVITGPSGAGKSTLVDLALGLLTPQGGHITIGDTVIDPTLLAWWRSHVAYVPQETVLIPGNLRDNLIWSLPGGADDNECRSALRRAASHFVDDLPDGLDTVLGDRGMRLSGGERQRVAIARALLRRPALLVLDEATSSLDDATEADVLETVSQLTPTVTVLMVAHRKSTIDVADLVVALRDGRKIP